MFHIVLVAPQIPQNTGNIARLCAATKSRLHVVKPMAFEITDKQVRRAGLDYWPEVDIVIHEGWEEFLRTTGVSDEQLWFFSTHATTRYYDVVFSDDDYLVFGNETAGLPEELQVRYMSRRLRIPMDNPNVRSFNLANAAAVGLCEARRQLVKEK